MRHWLLGFGLVLGCGDDSGRMNAATSLPPTTTIGDMTSGPDTGTSDDGPNTTEDEMTTTSSTSGPSESESGPTPMGSSCSYMCSVAADCLVGGMSYGHTCQTGKCVIPCTNPDGCVAYYSGWLIETCEASADCEFNTCIAFGDGFSGCAFTPDLGECAELGLEEIERMTVEGDPVTVCGEPDATCTDLGSGMECLRQCTDFPECYMHMTGEVCTAEGECVYDCVEASDCPATFDNVVPSCD